VIFVAIPRQKDYWPQKEGEMEERRRDTVLRVRTEFLERYKRFDASSRARLVREMLERLCALLGAKVEVRLISQPEMVLQLRGEPDRVKAAVEVTFQRIDNSGSNPRMVRQWLLFCIDNYTWTYLLSTQELVAIELDMDDIVIGKGVLNFLSNVCEYSLQVLVGEATAPQAT
jgi:hypothetical protein